ncbi:hypothetical protein FOZ62_029358, partial [Perkinsus olseni]
VGREELCEVLASRTRLAFDTRRCGSHGVLDSYSVRAASGLLVDDNIEDANHGK